MPILHSYYQDVYRCPIVRLDGYSAQHGLSTGILAYLDFGGATGSSKDGLAETMLAFATERGTLQPGMPVVEASSGQLRRGAGRQLCHNGAPLHSGRTQQPAHCPAQAAAGPGCAYHRLQQQRAPRHGARGRGHRQALRRILHPLFFQRRQPRVPPPRDGAADL